MYNLPIEIIKTIFNLVLTDGNKDDYNAISRACLFGTSVAQEKKEVIQQNYITSLWLGLKLQLKMMTEEHKEALPEQIYSLEHLSSAINEVERRQKIGQLFAEKKQTLLSQYVKKCERLQNAGKLEIVKMHLASQPLRLFSVINCTREDYFLYKSFFSVNERDIKAGLSLLGTIDLEKNKTAEVLFNMLAPQSDNAALNV